MQIGEVAMLIGVLLAPILWGALLNRRDRRRSVLSERVMRPFTAEPFRARVAAHVRMGVLSRNGVVTVDVLDCAHSEIAEVLARLAQVPGLSPNVSLAVNSGARQHLSRFSAVAVTLSPTTAPRALFTNERFSVGTGGAVQ